MFDFIRGLSSPGIQAFSYAGPLLLRMLCAELVCKQDEYAGRIPGKVIRLGDDGSVDVLAGQGTVRLHEVEVDGSSGSPRRWIKSVRTVKLGPAHDHYRAGKTA